MPTIPAFLRGLGQAGGGDQKPRPPLGSGAATFLLAIAYLAVLFVTVLILCGKN